MKVRGGYVGTISARGPQLLDILSDTRTQRPCTFGAQVRRASSIFSRLWKCKNPKPRNVPSFSMAHSTLLMASSPEEKEGGVGGWDGARLALCTDALEGLAAVRTTCAHATAVAVLHVRGGGHAPLRFFPCLFHVRDLAMDPLLCTCYPRACRLCAR